MPTLYPTVSKMSSPIDAATGTGAKYQITVNGPWSLADFVTLVMAETTSALIVQVGYGDITGKLPTFAFTYKNKVYLLCASSFFFSDLASPTVFNDINGTGNGYVDVQNFTAENEDLVAAASYQGRLALFSRRTTQIWNVTADPTDANFLMVQLLQNVGTMAKRSVQSVGDLDVFFLTDSGVRSLRVRDSSLNAFVVDVGSSIDLLIQSSLLTAYGSETNEAACGVVEPTSNRYWLYLKGLLYVLSYFPSSKIVGWTTFLPKYETLVTKASTIDNFGMDNVLHFTGLTIGNLYYWTKGNGVSLSQSGVVKLTATGYFVAIATTAEVAGPVGTTGVFATSTIAEVVPLSFIPTEFVTFDGQVFCRTAANQLVAYGGSDNNTYDHTQAKLETPWMSAKTPGTEKVGKSLDAAGSGPWLIKTGMDPIGGTLTQVSNVGSASSPSASVDSTFDRLSFPLQQQGTHFKVRAESSLACQLKCVFSSFVFHFQETKEKP